MCPSHAVASDLKKHLAPHLKTEAKPGDGEFLSITAEGVLAASHILRREPACTMSWLLRRHNIWPLRFTRNRGTMSAEEQAKLLDSKAAIIGCGGLGGYVAMLLARIGFGSLTLCDSDSFDESNLNRQLFSRETNLGRNKALIASEEIKSIASHTEINVYPVAATPENLHNIIEGADIVLDCLDSIRDRILLEKAVHKKELPFIHSSIAGYEGFAFVSLPSETGLTTLYDNQKRSEENNAEHLLGVPTITPAAQACLQASLAVSIILKRKVSHSLLHLDLSIPSIEAFSF